MPSLVEIGPVVLEKKTKMSKVYDNDNDGQRTNFYQKNSLDPSAQVSSDRKQFYLTVVALTLNTSEQISNYISKSDQ